MVLLGQAELRQRKKINFSEEQFRFFCCSLLGTKAELVAGAHSSPGHIQVLVVTLGWHWAGCPQIQVLCGRRRGILAQPWVMEAGRRWHIRDADEPRWVPSPQGGARGELCHHFLLAPKLGWNRQGMKP